MEVSIEPLTEEMVAKKSYTNLMRGCSKGTTSLAQLNEAWFQWNSLVSDIMKSYESYEEWIASPNYEEWREYYAKRYKESII